MDTEMLRLLLLLLVSTVVTACKLDFDCAQCHACKGGVCTPAPDYTDPNDECPERCGVKTVCGPLHICVFQKRPTCNCDWMEGVCIEEVVPVTLPTMEELEQRGLSDDDIKELMLQLREEHHRYHKDEHKGHFHILPDDEVHAHDIIFIHTTVMVIVFFAFIAIATACVWRRILDQEKERFNKSQ